ncbi:MAG: tyrosine--tRNA ligase [Gemmatimonadales bacterium]
MKIDLLSELTWRGLVQEHSPELPERLRRGPITGYVGFDPTAPSLQVGNLVPIMLLAHLQRSGGRPLVVLGGGTGLIGDPSGKRAERPLLGEDEIRANIDIQRAQFERFLDFESGETAAELVDNAEWLSGLDLIGFLREIGKHFTLSYMVQKESVKSRLETGISYTEFSYMLLQAYDFLQLYRTRGCELQLGGSDQWGNITAGTELIRRVSGGSAFGLCAPLLTTVSGAKFGKTEQGNVWLDASLTSPYRFYQYWINVDDRDVERYLRMFTFLSEREIADLMAEHEKDAGARIPHKALARDVTARVHGDRATRRAAEASRLAFGESRPSEANVEVLETLAAELPSSPLPAGFGPGAPVLELITSSGLAKSKSEARRLIRQGGITVNDRRVTQMDEAAGEPLRGGYYWVSRGKKNHYLFTAST